ncbi:MAG: hypothetical protein N7Q72_01775, partial [Spiroplasma sp. Tabriz.8]|nr:hypothetical protein [Spiroplasma sp. Tabriz.8]
VRVSWICLYCLLMALCLEWDFIFYFFWVKKCLKLKENDFYHNYIYIYIYKCLLPINFLAS